MIPLEVESNPGSNIPANHHGSEPATRFHTRNHVRPDKSQHNGDEGNDDEEEYEEVMGLLGRSSKKTPSLELFEEETSQGRQNSRRAWTWWILTMGVVGVMSLFLGHGENDWERGHTDERSPPMYECSTTHEESGQTRRYDPPITIPLDQNATVVGDKDMKANRRGWTDVRIAPYLLRSDVDGIANRVSILELASQSTGLNLFQTLQILEDIQAPNEHKTQFWIYGSDRTPFRSSFSLFHSKESLEKLPDVELGIFCGDETTPPPQDLTYLPSDAFDMVYTGRLAPLQDPLGLGGSPAELENKYQSLCGPDGDQLDEDGIPLKDLAQQAQEQWVVEWVTDMARVTRPGGLIVVENLSIPYCESQGEFGGVSKAWWPDVIEKHKGEWKVDTSSLQIGNDHLRRGRYHMAMKRKESE